ncbi:MAG: hypothetical protein OEV66_02060 [Spirochaetia bacterium]|nr:hypothetical protein [Spirochaetia bacterium]
MKKLIILAFLISVFAISNCETYHYGYIKKIGDRTYSLETEVVGLFSDKMYLALCTADASGNFKCVPGKNGAGFLTTGFGAVNEK